MARAKEKVLSLLGSATVDLAAAAGVEVVLYTNPSSKQMVPVLVIADDFDEAVDESVVTLGKAGGNCDEFSGVAGFTLTNISADFVDEALILQPVPATTPQVGMVLDAGESFAVEIDTQETTGAATCTMSLWGREKPV